MAKWMDVGKEKIEESLAADSTFARDFFLAKDGDSAVIRILDDEEVRIKDHFVKRPGQKWFTCSREPDCPLCEAGNVPTSHFVLNILDRRTWTDKEGKEHHDEVKLWRQVGVKIYNLLKKKRERYGPWTDYDIEITRIGSGQNTVYDVDVLLDTKDDELPDVELYDREEILAPKERANLISMLSGADLSDDDDKPAKKAKDEDEDDLPWR